MTANDKSPSKAAAAAVDCAAVPEASAWVRRFLSEIPRNAAVLDLACGKGRNSRLLLAAGFRVVAVDRDLSGFAEPEDDPKLTRILCDLEKDTPDLTSWVSKEAGYAGIVVANYLHRPLLPAILAALAPGGLLLYETFARGNERFGRPSSPDYLLKRGELLEVVRGRLQVLAYEDLVVQEPRPAAVQRIAARRLE